MASSTDYLEFVLDLLRDVPAVTNRKMMGEYLLYSDGVLFGGIYPCSSSTARTRPVSPKR